MHNRRIQSSSANIGGFGASIAVESGQVAQSVEQRIENPRVGGSIPPLATTIQRPTFLGWAFSFVLPPEHAGQRPILRVLGGCQERCQRRSVCPFFALCSLAKITNFSAILNTHLLVQQQLMRVSTFQVCRTGLEGKAHACRASSSSTGSCGSLRLQINACCQAHP